MLQDDKQFFDNTDDDFEQNEDIEGSEPLPANESDDDGEADEDGQPRNRGDRTKAIRHWRGKYKETEQRLEQQQQKLASLEAMYEQLNQRGYAPQQQQPDPSLIDQQRQQLTDYLWERPDEVLGNWAQQIQRQTYATQAPLMMDKVYEHAVRGDASLTEAMSIPVVREILDPYVQDILSQHGNMAQAAEQTKPLVGQVLKLINVGRELAQQAKPAQKVAPDRADSFAGKQANPSKQGIYGEQLADTLRGMTGEQRIQHLRSMQTKR